MSETVGKRIKEIRKRLGCSMEEFASKIDCNAKSGTVANWETNKNLPNNIRLKRIAELGNVTVEFLLNGTEVDVSNLINENKRLRKALEDIASTGYTYLEVLKIASKALESGE